MAKRQRPPQQEEPPADWTPTQAVEQPVINNPYDEPLYHWLYKDGNPTKVSGRRPASYWFKSKKTGSAQKEFFAEEERDDLPLINCLRADVKRWRESGYRGATPVTKELFAYWYRTDRHRRLFFCQREAVESVIYLLEIGIPGHLQRTGFKNFQVDHLNLARLLAGERPILGAGGLFEEDFFPSLVDAPGDAASLALRRLGCKMATGSGKTVVMAMIIAWAFSNRGRNPATTSFPNAVLVCAPNLTVKNRLQVLRPEHSQNYYEEFDLLPAKFRDLLGGGRILVTNWHAFAPKSPHREGDTSYRVVQKGEETPEAFAKDRLGELVARLPILVLNDEGHHCWRPKSDSGNTKESTKGLTKEEQKTIEEEVEEARVWLAGLDRINNAGLLGTGTPCVLACVDLSATPFHLSNSGYHEGSPFPWLVSDFGLVDAIESGIVKIPRLPVRDDTGSKDDAGRPDPKYFRLWRHINENLGPADRTTNGRPKAEAVYREAESALATLAGQWKKRFDDIRQASPGEAVIPPVMIIVCDNTEVAEIVFQKISGEKVVEVPKDDGKGTEKQTVYESSAILPELANADGVRHTVRIDSDLLQKIETEEGETKDQAAKALREIIGTIGRRGGPGEQVRCVVSVSMLTEGWDATNVTHILGIRAFGSQLLCEQVVGRGLRRMNYTPDPVSKLLSPEYVDVYGIPFSLIPFKGKPKEDSDVDPVYHHIFAVEEKAAFEIRMPVVESYTYDLKESGIECDVDKLDGFVVNDEPTKVYLTLTRGYHDDSSTRAASEFVEQNRDEYYKAIRFQQVLFNLAQMILGDLVGDASGPGAAGLKQSLRSRQQLFPEILRIVEQYVGRKVTFAKGVNQRELGLQKYATLLRERVRNGIVDKAASSTAPLLPIVNSFRPYTSTADVNYRTTRPVAPLTKCHLNLGMIQSSWERETVEILESIDAVECYTPNDRNVGLVIPYEYLESSHRYEPDFVVRLNGGKLLMIEIKGGKGEIHDEDRVNAKNAAARKWVAAVNNAGRYGAWIFEICRDMAQLRSIIEKHAQRPPLPFQFVEPKAGDHFKTCVPLTSLRAAADRWSEEQILPELTASWATEWVTFDAKTRFEPGMFVAQVKGDSMEPEIPNGAYCLFRAPRAGTRQGRKLLVWHAGVTDPETGGEYTLKVFSSEKAGDADTGWQHERITLKPLNPAYEPIVLIPRNKGDVRVVAEWVEVVRGMG